MRKVMLLAAVVAMVLAAAVPALAQVTQIGDGNIACVQTAVQQNVASQGGNAVAGEDNVIANTNINAQAISQDCNINVTQVNTIAKKALTFNKAGNVVVEKKFATATASATASAKAAPVVQYKVKKMVATATASATASVKAAPVVQYQYKAPAAVQYKAAAVQYKAAAVQYQYATASASAAPTAKLPPTGGSSLIALGAGVLLVAGGLLARKIVR